MSLLIVKSDYINKTMFPCRGENVCWKCHGRQWQLTGRDCELNDCWVSSQGHRCKNKSPHVWEYCRKQVSAPVSPPPLLPNSWPAFLLGLSSAKLLYAQLVDICLPWPKFRSFSRSIAHRWFPCWWLQFPGATGCDGAAFGEHTWRWWLE